MLAGARSYTPMMTACALSHQETAAAIVDLLISECGFMQFDATDKDGFTCLHWAAACGGAPVVTRLLAEKPGPRIDARSVSGDTPLMRAARLGRTGCVKLLVQAGADVHAMNKAKHTALDVAGIYKERRSPTLRKAVRKVGPQHPRQWSSMPWVVATVRVLTLCELRADFRCCWSLCRRCERWCCTTMIAWSMVASHTRSLQSAFG